MGKVKSAILTVLYSVILAVLLFLCVVPTFTLSKSSTGAVQDFNSVLKVMQTDVSFSGGYSMTYYPEGVLSSEEYEDLSADKKGEYTQHGSLYLGKEVTENGAVEEEFDRKAKSAIDTLCYRFKSLNLDYLKIEALDDYAVRVEVPSSVTNASQFFAYMGVSGEFTLENSVKNSPLLKATSLHGLDYYFKKVDTRAGTNIALHFTKEGRAEMAKITQKVAANEDDQVLSFRVGGMTLISLTTASEIDESVVYITGYSDEYLAKAVAAVLDSCVRENVVEVDYKMGNLLSFEGTSGKNMPTMLFVGIGVALLALAVFSIVKYRGFGAAHVYGILSYFVIVVMCIGFIETIYLSMGSVLAILLGVLLFTGSAFYLFEKIKKEYVSGKRIQAAAKEGYKKSLFGILDVHAVCLIASVFFAFVPIGSAASFGVAMLTCTLTSAAVSLGIIPAMLFLLKGMAKDEYKFCHFKREVIDDED